MTIGISYTSWRCGALAILCVMLAAGAGAQQERPATASAAPAKAGSAAAGLSDKYDTSLPVEISADNLEVLQQESKAIFKGNVVAVQGKIRLKADRMIVHYKQTSAANQPAKAAAVKPSPAAADNGTGAMGAITLIEVEGNVFMATPEESAKGDRGNYQVPERILHLTGDNVTLTRDKNILRGTELEYNMATGRSLLTNHGAKVGDVNGGRVRGVFVPNQDNGKSKGKNDKAGPAPAASTSPAPSAQGLTTVAPAVTR